MNLGLVHGTVKLEKHNKKWKSLFTKESKKLKNILTRYDIQIFHIGSTSIPNLIAKPIIDILIVIPDNNYNNVADLLGKNQYHLCSFQPRNEILFKKGDSTLSTYYYHLVTLSDDWQRYTAFRDYLINNSNELRKYEDLKIELAKKYANNRREYTSKKNSFVEEIVLKSRKKAHNNV